MTPAPHSLLQALDAAAVGAADALACAALLRQSKQVRGWLDAFDSEVTARLDALATTGESFGSEDSHVRNSGVSARDAAKLKERSRTLEQAAGFGAALAAGAVTAGHVDQLAAVAGHLSEDLRAALFERSADLLAHATAHDPGRFGRHARDVARRLERDAGVTRDRQQHANTYLSWKVATDGMYDVHARLHPVLGARLVKAIDAEVAARIAAGEAAGRPEFVDRTVSRGRLAAEALVDFVSANHQMVRPVVADISVLVDADTLATGEYHDHSVCESGDGAPLPISSVRALLCSGLITPVFVDADGNVLDVGRTRRTPNRAQRRALRAMYRTCAAAGCDVPFGRCEIHHIVPWELGGPTDLGNLLPVCARHHHLIHALRWRLHLAPDRTLTVTDPDGEVVMVTTPDVRDRVRRTDQRRTKPDRAAPLAS